MLTRVLVATNLSALVFFFFHGNRLKFGSRRVCSIGSYDTLGTLKPLFKGGIFQWYLFLLI